MEQTLLEKYENYGWLQGIDESKKEELIQLYEDATFYLRRQKYINTKIETFFAPLLYRMFKENIKHDYKTTLLELNRFMTNKLDEYSLLGADGIDYEVKMLSDFVDSKKPEINRKKTVKDGLEEVLIESLFDTQEEFYKKVEAYLKPLEISFSIQHSKIEEKKSKEKLISHFEEKNIPYVINDNNILSIDLNCLENFNIHL